MMIVGLMLDNGVNIIKQFKILRDYKIHIMINISKDKKAWMLIKAAGSDNLKEGDAMISKKHCNFFVNNGNARSLDIENLINKVKKKVFEKTGINLELEIKIIGEKKI